MSGNRGFSLLELMWVLVLGTLIIGSLLATVYQTQVWSGNLATLVDRDQNTHPLPILFARWISAAGNNRSESNFQPLAVGTGEFSVRSDLEGNRGFPDGLIDDPYEDIEIRATSSGLQLKSGRGSFQSVARSVTSIDAELQSERLIKLRWRARSPLRIEGSKRDITESMELFLGLPNLRGNLFAEID